MKLSVTAPNRLQLELTQSARPVLTLTVSRTIVLATPGNAFSNHTHVQILPAAIWTIAHGLGYNPAGIIVYDSAGSQWCADNVSYPDLNTVVLNFSPVSFAGKAYLS